MAWSELSSIVPKLSRTIASKVSMFWDKEIR